MKIPRHFAITISVIPMLVVGIALTITTVNAFADSVPVEVRSWIDPGIIYGSGWIYPLRSPGWHAVVDQSAVVIARSAACS